MADSRGPVAWRCKSYLYLTNPKYYPLQIQVTQARDKQLIRQLSSRAARPPPPELT